MRWLALLLFAIPLSAQAPWIGIIENNGASQARAIDWSNTGLPATFPDLETTANPWTPPIGRSQCGSTENNTRTEAQIQTDYNACAAGTYLLLGPGLFPAWTANFNMKSNVTLRGSGADPVTGTIIDCGGNTVGGISCPTWAGAGAPSCTWTGVATATAGSTTTTVTGCTPHVNDLIVFEVTGPGFDIGTADFYLCSGSFGICGQTASGGAPTGNIEQLMRVTNFSAPTVTFDPPMRFNYSNSNYITPVSAILTSPVTGAGLENMRILGDVTSGSAIVFMVNGYADWMTGVQIINASNGIALTSTVVVQDCHHCLIFENDIWQGLTTAGGAAITKKTVSDTLIMNNDLHVGNDYCQPTGCVDNADMFNYIHDSYYPTGNTIITNVQVEHVFTHFNLYEGNQAAGLQIDMDHESHSADTTFRNNYYANDQPFLNPQGVRAIEHSGYARFMNDIGNILCANTTSFTSTCNNYIGHPDGAGVTNNCVPGSSVFWLGCNGQPWPMDPMAQTTAMLWGNCDSVNAACRFVNSEVPSGYTEIVGHQLALTNTSGTTWSGTIPGGNLPCVNGQSLLNSGTVDFAYDYKSNGTLTNALNVTSASVNCTTGLVSAVLVNSPATLTLNYVSSSATPGARQNPVPPNQTLPPSFSSKLPQSPHPNGGTGIGWWKVSKNYPTNTLFVTQPWPLCGPDVANGPYTTVAGGGSGTCYDTPMKVWDQNSPIDTTLQTSYAITSWGMFSGGIQPITIPVPSTGGNATTIILTGEFQISGASPSACNGTYHITGASFSPAPYTIKFALASNPGCSGGSFLFPDVHRFSNTAFTLDPPIPWAPNANGRDYINGGPNGRSYNNGVNGTNGRKYP